MTLDTPDYSQLRLLPRQFRLFGLHIAHSKAPALHNFIFNKLNLNWRYNLFESDDIEAFKQYLRDPATLGSAVTMPHKVTMCSHVDLVDSGASLVGAINTIYKRKNTAGEDILIGTNTDTIGIRDAFHFNARETVDESISQSLPGLVYGGGGACRSAVYALHEFMKCTEIYIVNRFASEVDAVKASMEQNGFTGKIVHIASPEQAHRVEKPKLVVLTVPDFAPALEEELLAKQTLDVFMKAPDKGAVLEMCYHPNPSTRLHREFEKHKWNVIGGVEAMIYQGIAQQVLWTGYGLDEMPVEEVSSHVYSTL